MPQQFQAGQAHGSTSRPAGPLPGALVRLVKHAPALAATCLHLACQNYHPRLDPLSALSLLLLSVMNASSASQA